MTTGIKNNSHVSDLLRGEQLLRKRVAIIGVCVLIAAAIPIHLAPVSFDAGACSGGFTRHIITKYSGRYTGLASQLISTLEPFEIVSSSGEISNNTWWDGRYIYTKLKVKGGNNIVTISYQGKRYWLEMYDWKITHIE